MDRKERLLVNEEEFLSFPMAVLPKTWDIMYVLTVCISATGLCPKIMRILMKSDECDSYF